MHFSEAEQLRFNICHISFYCSVSRVPFDLPRYVEKINSLPSPLIITKQCNSKVITKSLISTPCE